MTTLSTERLSFTVPLGGRARRTLAAPPPVRSKCSTILVARGLAVPTLRGRRDDDEQRGSDREALRGEGHRAIEAVIATKRSMELRSSRSCLRTSRRGAAAARLSPREGMDTAHDCPGR
jgi:hypothetical protein